MAMGGLYYEEFSPGQRFEHVLRRTVTEADNLLFSALTHNPAALHLDEEYMKGTEFGSRIVNSCFTLSLMVGVSVEMRESRSRPDAGIVVFLHRCFNQRNEEVAICKRTALMKRKAVA